MKRPQRITADLKIMTGKPVVAGTRIPVERVLEHLAQDLDLEDLFAAYPRLTHEDVKACLEYSAEVMQEHGKEVRQQLRIQAAADELKAMILERYSNATFDLTPDENSREGFWLNVTVDVEDTDQIMDLVVDRVVDFSIQGIPIHVLPERARSTHKVIRTPGAFKGTGSARSARKLREAAEQAIAEDTLERSRQRRE